MDGGLGTSACYGPGFLLIIRGEASRRAKKKKEKEKQKGKKENEKQKGKALESVIRDT